MHLFTPRKAGAKIARRGSEGEGEKEEVAQDTKREKKKSG